ncbi:CUB and sushi domain-containing protein 2, partial [Geodia barretti]
MPFVVTCCAFKTNRANGRGRVVDCGELMDPENGAVNVTNTTFNSTATYSCNGGYNLVGDATRTCLASASWSG